jgi:hypothetical protein
MKTRMHRHLVMLLALWSLLTQTLVAGAPGAVLCITASEGACAVAAQPGVCACCAEAPESPRTMMRLCTPCHDSCGDCIEVGLPRETSAATASTMLPALTMLGLAFAREHAISVVSEALPAARHGAGPPERHLRSEALIITTTILLV